MYICLYIYILYICMYDIYYIYIIYIINIYHIYYIYYTYMIYIWYIWYIRYMYRGRKFEAQIYRDAACEKPQHTSDVCWCMPTYADVCLLYADVCCCMLTYACTGHIRMLTYADECWRMHAQDVHSKYLEWRMHAHLHRICIPSTNLSRWGSRRPRATSNPSSLR